MFAGLDPSGPRFQGMPDVVRLSPSNAKYVEVLHTDASDGNIVITVSNFDLDRTVSR